MQDITLNLDQDYMVMVRLLPSGEEVELELPAASNGKAIKESLLEHEELNIPKMDHEGNRYNYKLISKGSGKEVTDDRSLFECGVASGDTLLLSPTLVAG